MSSTTPSQYQMQPWRLWVIYGVVTFVLGSLLYRLVTLQVIQGTDWLDQAVENYTTTESIAPPRGIIYDRNGFILAGNIASYNVVITPADLPDSEADIQNIYRQLSALIAKTALIEPLRQRQGTYRTNGMKILPRSQ